VSWLLTIDDAKQLLRAGADVIAHSVRDKEIDGEFISLMKKRNIPYCPTLTRELSTFVYESTPAFFSDPFFLREADPEVIAQLKEPQRQEAMRKSASAQGYKSALPTAQKNLKKAMDAFFRPVAPSHYFFAAGEAAALGEACGVALAAVAGVIGRRTPKVFGFSSIRSAR